MVPQQQPYRGALFFGEMVSKQREQGVRKEALWSVCSSLSARQREMGVGEAEPTGLGQG